MGVNCYNMFYSVGLTLEQYYTLKTMTDRTSIPKMVIMGVDDILCFNNSSLHRPIFF